MSRLPIRVRLTAAFAAATALVLIAAAAFVYVQLRADLDESVDSALEARATAVAASGVAAGVAGDAEDGFAQVQSRDGRVIEAAGGARGPVEPVSGDRRVPGIDGTARVLARDSGTSVVVVGQTLEDRDEVLAGLDRGVRDRRSARDPAGLAARLRARRQPVCGRSRRCAGAPPRATSGCRCPPRTTRSTGWARR